MGKEFRWLWSVAAAAAKPCDLSPPGRAAHWPANHTGQGLVFPIAARCQQGRGNLAGLVMALWGRCVCVCPHVRVGPNVCVPFFRRGWNPRTADYKTSVPSSRV